MSSFKYDVFLSFASANEKLAQPLWKQLELSGLRVFWSDATLKDKVGESWYEVIEESLEQSRHLVLLWSKEAKTSEFVRKEYRAFDSIFRKEGERLLVPVLIPRTNHNSLPVFLRAYQFFRLQENMGQLITALGGRYEPLEAENARLREKLVAVEEEIEALKKTQDAGDTKELGALQKKYAVLHEKWGREKDTTKSLKADKQALTEEMRALEKANASQAAKLTAYAAQVSKLQQEIAVIKEATLEQEKVGGSRVKSPPKNLTDKGIEFILVEPGKFMMGSEEIDRAKVIHEVTVTKPFYLAKYQLTQGQWQSVTGKNPSNFKGDNRPVEQVSWMELQAFIKQLGEAFRLPTEAEWEYACRAGTTTAYSFGDDVGRLGDYAWYWDNANNKTHPVGKKKPNPWGLFDMHGNVMEWVSDRYSASYEPGSKQDPQGPETGSSRVIRGGGWSNNASNLRSAYRYGLRPGHRYGIVGFRLVRRVL